MTKKSKRITHRDICSTEHCDNQILYPNLGVCSACYQAIWSWKQRSVKDILQRKKNLRKFAARMQVIEPAVSVMPQHKRGRG